MKNKLYLQLKLVLLTISLSIIPSFAHAYQAIGPVDFLVTASTTSLGSRVSTSTANTATVNGTPWYQIDDNTNTNATSSANFTWQPSHNALIAPVIVNGTTYGTSTPTHSMALYEGNPYTTITGGLNSATTSATIAGWVTFGVPDAGFAQQTFDDVFVFGSNGQFFGMQNYNGTFSSGNYFVWIETGTPTQHSPAIQIPVGATFWFNLTGSYVTGVAQLALYDTHGNLFGYASTTMSTSDTLGRVVVGNNEAGTAVGTTTFEDLILDQTTAAFPLIGTDSVNPAHILVVGGGGQGGENGGGGGGGGGVEERTNYPLLTGTYNVTVGLGATATSGVERGGNGATSTFNDISAGGGGGGSGRDPSNEPANSAATGGGGGGAQTTATAAHGSGYGGLGYEGYDGGDGATIPRGFDPGCGNSGGGGGGEGGAGVQGNFVGGNGGIGRSFTISGSSVYYGGGGGGAEVCTGNAGDGTGGLGGGANGSSTAALAGTNGLGGGGGGTSISAPGGHGGNGTVIISFVTGSITASCTGGCVKTTSGGNDIYTFTSNGTFTVGGATSSIPPFGIFSGNSFNIYNGSSFIVY